MKHLAEADLITPFAKISEDAKEVGNRGRMGALVFRIVAAGIATWLGCSSAKAQDQLSEPSIDEQPISASYFIDFSQTPSLFLAHAPETIGYKIRELFHVFDTEQDHPISEQALRHQDSDGDRSITLFHKRRSSRYSYQGWADLGTGFGRIFAAETFGRSRTNGVGVEDPDWFYFKMSFKF